MQLKELIIYIENHGISIIFTLSILSATYKYLVPLLKDVIATQKEILIFMKNHNSGILSGEKLDKISVLEIERTRWSIQRECNARIEQNHIKEKWDDIVVKLNNRKLQAISHFEETFFDISDVRKYEKMRNIFKEKVDIGVNSCIDLLSKLKNVSEEDREKEYKNMKRTIDTHMYRIELELKKEINDILN